MALRIPDAATIARVADVLVPLVTRADRDDSPALIELVERHTTEPMRDLVIGLLTVILSYRRRINQARKYDENEKLSVLLYEGALAQGQLLMLLAVIEANSEEGDATHGDAEPEPDGVLG